MNYQVARAEGTRPFSCGVLYVHHAKAMAIRASTCYTGYLRGDGDRMKILVNICLLLRSVLVKELEKHVHFDHMDQGLLVLSICSIDASE